MNAATRSEKLALLAAIAEKERRASQRQFYNWFPDEGPYRRELYPKHLEFFRRGMLVSDRCFLAGNRCGKTIAGLYEIACHLTGIYPAWWEGRRFTGGVKAWIASGTSKDTRDILQVKMLGAFGKEGTGILLGEKIIAMSKKVGIPDAYDSVQVKHASGGTSLLQFKSYEQGRATFQGTEQHVIMLDEEPPAEVNSECLLRTAAVGDFEGGLLINTFTPLSGITEVVQGYIIAKDEGNPHRALITCGWDDVPHISEDEKTRLIASMPAHEREARTKGIPQLGSGLIFPVPDEMISVDPFPIPRHWPRIAAIDFGWDHPTAVVWGAIDRDTDTTYIYAEYGASQTLVPVHADAVKARGQWIPLAWPHDGDNNTAVGPSLASQYRNKGVNMLPERAQMTNDTMSDDTKQVKTSVEGGLSDMLTAFNEGRLKIFTSCTRIFSEKRWYRRENGKVVKQGDDYMAALRYLWISREFAQVQPSAFGRVRSIDSWKVA